MANLYERLLTTLNRILDLDVDRTTFPLISECRLHTKKIHTVGYEITTSDPTDNDKITIEK